MQKLVLVAAIVVVLNLPFGFWRAGVQRFSMRWFISIHAPIPLIISLRYLSGLGWRFVTFPVLMGAFFTGQFLGAKLRGRSGRGP